MAGDIVEATAQEAMTAFRVPGAALCVRRGGKTIREACFGVTSLDSGRPVTPHSLFDIGSLTKPYTTAAMALLVEDGLLHWDDPVIDHLPEFRLPDPWVTREATIRDLLGHRLGQGQDNFTDYKSNLTREQVVHQMRYLRQAVPFRSEAFYNNYGMVTAGVIVERLTGLTWEEFIERRIFAPLGLRDSYADITRVPDPATACDAHADFGDGKVVTFPHDEIPGLAPAGSIVASLRDVASFMDVFAAGGTGLLSPNSVRELHKPGALFDPLGPLVRSRIDANFIAYGMGWFCHDFHGHAVFEHTGSIMGFSALGMVVPALDLSLVVLANMQMTPLRSVLRSALLAEHLGVAHRDWIAETKDNLALPPAPPRMIDGEPYFWTALDRRTDTAPSRPLEEYVGTYSHPGFGDAPVWLEDGHLVVDLVGNVCDLEHWHNDLFRGTARDQGTFLDHPHAWVRFADDPSGQFNRLIAPTIGEYHRRSGN